MDRPELLNELSLRTGVEPSASRAVFDALLDLVREGAISADVLLFPTSTNAHALGVAARTPRLPVANHADPLLVDDLIDRARKHRLGIDFLRDGLLGSVAAEFGAHAFTVEAARQRLQNERKDQ